jgi:hypothetical protein
MLGAQQIEQRLPVWCALAELFVDTEFDATSARSVAEALRASHLPLPELERILRDEVAPVFHRNAFAGNWTGWPADEVQRLVVEHLRSREAWAARLTQPFAGMLRRARMAAYEPAWNEVKQRLEEPT